MPLTLTFAMSIASVVAYLGLLLMALALARGADARVMRAFAGLAATALLISLAALGQAVLFDDAGWMVRLARVGLAASAAHVAAWYAYLPAVAGRPATRAERATAWALAGVAGLALVPGLLVSPQVTLSTVHEQARAADVHPTGAGVAAFALLCLALAVVVGRLARARWRGVPHAGWSAAGGVALLAAAVNDSLVSSRIVGGLLVGDLGLLALVVGTGAGLMARLVAQARELERLSSRLEGAVADRTRELERALGALVRAERLAMVGRLSAAMAHELNSPAAAVASNLAFVQRSPAVTALPAEAREALDDALASMRRITGVVRRLLDAGRVIGGPSRRGLPVDLAAAAARAGEEARRALGGELRLSLEVPPGLHALGDGEVVVLLLAGLVVLLSRDGRRAGRAGAVALRASRAGASVVLHADGDGPAVPPARRAAFLEQLVAPAGNDLDLGPAVLQGLLQSQGGDLRLADGDRLVLVAELPWCAPGATDAAPPASG